MAAVASPAVAARHSPAAISATHPPGYQIVSSGLVSAPPGSSSSGAFATCPAGTVVWGGGVGFSAEPSQSLSVNTSSPNGSSGWEGWVNNTGTTTEQFTADAICAGKPAGYKIVSDSFTLDLHSLLLDSLTCPSGTSALDGGTQVTAHAPAVQISGSIDLGHLGWSVAVNNTGPATEPGHSYVICAA